MSPVGRDFGQRGQDEGSFLHPWMRQLQVAEDPDEPIHGHDIEVESPWRPLLATVSTEAALDRGQLFVKRLRLEPCPV